jgi:hypothetical protein
MYMAAKLGWTYSDMLASIISTAQHRALERQSGGARAGKATIGSSPAKK